MVEEKGIARLSLAPRDVRCGVPQGAHFVRAWGGHPGQRAWRRGFVLARSRASRFSSCPSAPEAGSIPMVFRHKKKVVEEKGIEPSTPTLRTWCSPS